MAEAPAMPPVSSPVVEARPERSRREIRDWLSSRIGRHLGRPAEQVDPALPFATFGLDSITMVGISSELERWVSQPLPPTLLYDAPTIEALARHLSDEESEEPEAVVASHDDDRSGAIAIIGMSGRFPGVDSIEAFWDLLREGRDGVGEVPEGRWSAIPPGLATRCGGFLRQVDQFDPQFFGIAPREAVFTDPQHRLLLEVAWEALENGGQAADRLAGREVGVFIGISSSDYGRMLAAGPHFTDAYLASGNALSLAANRLSYHLDLRGPSLAVDTACSSSLTALHLACRSIRNGECTMALVGGVNLILSPDLSLALSMAQMLSPSGRCRTFDASADGYVRGEGCGVVVLKPLAAAIHDRDRVLAVIRGSATNQDGKSNGITAPNRNAQVALIRAALQDARVEPGAIGYVEAHGTGTVLGDPIEFDALKAVFSEGDRPCFVGTVKTNIGHLESAAGIAGLIKAVLQLQHGAIAPHLHLRRQSPHIGLEGTRLAIPTTLQPWEPGPERRLAGVSSFGFGGANAHIVLEEAPRLALPRPEPASDRPAHLLTLSARSIPALSELANRFLTVLSADEPAGLADIAYTANAGRVHFPQRLAIRGRTRDEVRAGLDAFLEGTKREGVHVGTARREPAARLAFLFTGQGSQYLGMARGLYRTSPTFRASLDRLDGAFRRHVGPSLVEALLGTDPASLGRTSFVQPALFAVGSALAELWRSWGVAPAAVLGHSLGEYVAAAVAGVFTPEDGLRLVAERGRLMEERCPEGAMAAVFGPLDLVADRLGAWGDSLSIAAINGPANTVIAGAPAAVQAACEEFRNEAIFAQPLAVSRAYHSPLIAPALEAFERVVRETATASPRIPLISNLTGAPIGPEAPDSSYWCRHARQPVRFLDGVRWLHEHGFDLFVEIGPTATLSSLGRACLPDASAAWLPSLRPGRDDWSTLLDALGTLETQGLAIDWEAFDAPYGRRRVALPTYPFERSRCWIDMPSPTPTAVPEPTPSRAEERPIEGRAADSDSLYHLCWEPCSRWEQRIERPSARSLPSPRQLAELVEPTLGDLQKMLGREHGRDLRSEFDAIAAGYIRNAWLALGGVARPSKRIEPGALGVLPKYRRLLGRLLEILAEDGWLRRSGTAFEVARAIEPADVEPAMTALIARYPTCNAELTLASACGNALADVLRGDRDPLDVLLHDGSTALLEKIYEESPFARLSNTLAAEALARAIERLPRDRVVRILEIGAGTGGTTSYVLPRLPADRCEYVFTDVSSHFTTLARAKYRDVRFVRYATLDIERDPAESGFAPHQFDVVLAANVLHATGDLRRSLRNARSLLVPDGLLMLIEGTGPQRLLDLIFGLTEGWWKFNDHDLRPDYPLISRGRWADLLRHEGFAEPMILPSGDDIEATRQAVILARGPATVEDATPSGPTTPESLGWLIFADDALGPRLSGHLGALGDHSLVITMGDRFERLGPEHYSIRPDRDDDYRTLLSHVRHNGHAPCRRVVDLRGLDGPAGPPDGVALGSALRLARAIGGEGSGPFEEQLCLVTRGAVALGHESAPMSLGRSPLWGLGRAIQDAWAGLRTRLIDLDPRPLSEAAMAQLAIELHSADVEDAVAIRDGQRMAARIDRLTVQGTEGPNPWRSEGLYLVVGDPGQDGLQLARAIAARGGRSLAVLSHSSDSKGTTWSRSGALDDLGASLITANADLTDEARVSALLRPVQGTIKGVVYLATRSTTTTLDDRAIEESVRSSALGAWHLHRALESSAPEVFVLVGSPAALLGSLEPGRIADASSGAFLDALAHERRRDGRPALTVFWPPRHPENDSSKAGGAWATKILGALDRLGGEDARDVAQVVALPSDWLGGARSDQRRAHAPLLRRLLDQAPSPTSSPRDDSQHPFHLAGTNGDRRAALEEYLQSELARLLGLPASAVTLDRPVTSFGLDSLMAIQLKNRVETNLGVALSIVTMLEGLSLSEIAGKILEDLGHKEHDGAEQLNGRNGTHHPRRFDFHANGSGGSNVERLPLQQMVDDFDGLSESELDQMIDDLISGEDDLDGLNQDNEI